MGPSLSLVKSLSCCLRFPGAGSSVGSHINSSCCWTYVWILIGFTLMLKDEHQKTLAHDSQVFLVYCFILILSAYQFQGLPFSMFSFLIHSHVHNKLVHRNS